MADERARQRRPGRARELSPRVTAASGSWRVSSGTVRTAGCRGRCRGSRSATIQKQMRKVFLPVGVDETQRRVGAVDPQIQVSMAAYMNSGWPAHRFQGPRRSTA